MTAHTRIAPSPHVEAFTYPSTPADPFVPAWEGGEEAPPEGDEANGPEPVDPAPSEIALRAEFDRRMSEETRRSFQTGREKGRAEGRVQEREAQAAAATQAEQRRKRQVVEVAERFAEERNRYFEQVEREVVELALAVSARILRREAQMDPLLLSGAVRVALGQLSHAAGVTLQVPESELDMWIETIALMPNLSVKPRVEAGEGMRLGDCFISTELGAVDLGIRAQMAEIERGFFDRAGSQRNREKSPSDGDLSREQNG